MTSSLFDAQRWTTFVLIELVCSCSVVSFYLLCTTSIWFDIARNSFLFHSSEKKGFLKFIIFALPPPSWGWECFRLAGLHFTYNCYYVVNCIHKLHVNVKCNPAKPKLRSFFTLCLASACCILSSADITTSESSRRHGHCIYHICCSTRVYTVSRTGILLPSALLPVCWGRM